MLLSISSAAALGKNSRQIITLTAAAYLVWKVKSASLYLNSKYLNLKLNLVEAETTKLNEGDNFLPVAREADLSTGPT